MLSIPWYKISSAETVEAKLDLVGTHAVGMDSNQNTST